MVFRVFKFISNALASFDSFPVPVSLLIKGEADVKNFVGGFVSILSFLWSFYLTWGTIVDFYSGSNPTVITNIEYDIENDTLKNENFFFSVSFFSMKKDNKKLSNETNNYEDLFFINNLTYECEECYLNDKKLNLTDNIMNLCSDEYTKDITISGLSKNKSENIIEIFSKYSYCIPDGIQTTIKNQVENKGDMEYSLEILIPTQNTAVDPKSVPKNSQNKTSVTRDFTSVALNTQKTPEKDTTTSDSKNPTSSTPETTSKGDTTTSGTTKPEPTTTNPQKSDTTTSGTTKPEPKTTITPTTTTSGTTTPTTTTDKNNSLIPKLRIKGEKQIKINSKILRNLQGKI